MSDEDIKRLERQLEGLLASYGAVMEAQTRHTERIDYAARDRLGLHDAIRELRTDLLAAIAHSEQRQTDRLEEVDEECRAFRAKAEKWREDDEKARRVALEGRVSNRTIVLAMIAGSATVLAAIISAAAVIFTGG